MKTLVLSIAQHLHLSTEEVTFLEQTKLLSRKKTEQGEEACHEQV